MFPGQAICYFYSEPRFRANPVLLPVISYRLYFKMFTWNTRRGRKEKKCNCCASSARVHINNGRFKTSQKLIELRKNVVPQPPLIKSALLLAKKLSQSFDQILIYPARDTIHILSCFALAGGRGSKTICPVNHPLSYCCLIRLTMAGCHMKCHKDHVDREEACITMCNGKY